MFEDTLTQDDKTTVLILKFFFFGPQNFIKGQDLKLNI
jgi:hypothetical protein